MYDRDHNNLLDANEMRHFVEVRQSNISMTHRAFFLLVDI